MILLQFNIGNSPINTIGPFSNFAETMHNIKSISKNTFDKSNFPHAPFNITFIDNINNFDSITKIEDAYYSYITASDGLSTIIDFVVIELLDYNKS